MPVYPNELRIPCPLGYRVDTQKVATNIDEQLRILAANAGVGEVDSIRRTVAAAAQIKYLTRLQAQALARNGRVRNATRPAAQRA